MKYSTSVEQRHSYNLLIIRPFTKKDEYSHEVVGTLRFDNDELGNKELELWQKMILNMEMDPNSGKESGKA